MGTGIMFGNRILDVAFIAWFIAQGYKVIGPLLSGKKNEL